MCRKHWKVQPSSLLVECMGSEFWKVTRATIFWLPKKKRVAWKRKKETREREREKRKQKEARKLCAAEAKSKKKAHKKKQNSTATDITQNMCCECLLTYEQDIEQGTGAEGVECVCGRWLHEEYIDHVEHDETGQEKLCSSCCAWNVCVIIQHYCV